MNSGPLGDVMRLLEESLERPLQRIVCLLHTNELPLRHLMVQLMALLVGRQLFMGRFRDWRELPSSRDSTASQSERKECVELSHNVRLFQTAT